MTLLQLKYYCTACECGSITEAAKKVFVTQPTITLAIRELEKEYHIKLIERKGKGINLTVTGKEFYERALVMLNHVQEFEREIHDMSGNKRYIRLGITNSFGSSVYTEYFLYARSPYSREDIRLNVGTPAQLLEQIRSQQLDVILMPGDIIEALGDLESVVLKQINMLYCISRNHPLAEQEKITVPMLIKEKFISTKNDKNKNNRLKRLFLKYGYNQEPNVIQRFDQLSIAMKMVEADMGAGYFSEEVISQYAGIVGKKIEGDTTVPVRIVWLKGPWVREEVQALVTDIKNFYCLNNQ